MQTQCPHCHTCFRLTEEQLSVAQGLVRCGVCQQVFNALEDKDNSISNEHDDNTLFTNEPINYPGPAMDTPALEPSEDGTDNSHEFDLFSEENTDEPGWTPTVVPDDYREPPAQDKHSSLNTWLWGASIIFLAFTLVAEYLWFNRNQLVLIPEAQGLIEQLCKYAPCEAAALRNPNKIELVSRNIYSHPNQKHALMISVTLVNHASFAQAYPDMQIDFSDIRGNIVATRRFGADEYLQIPEKELRPLDPDLPVSFTLEVKDPGKQAMTYEFSFL